MKCQEEFRNSVPLPCVHCAGALENNDASWNYACKSEAERSIIARSPLRLTRIKTTSMQHQLNDSATMQQDRSTRLAENSTENHGRKSSPWSDYLASVHLMIIVLSFEISLRWYRNKSFRFRMLQWKHCRSLRLPISLQSLSWLTSKAFWSKT